MTVDIEKLKALALAATPGPWMRLFGERTVYDKMEDGCRGNAIVRADLAYGMQDGNNLDYIAAANPAAVLELIAEVERLRPTPAAGTAEKDAARYQYLREADWDSIKSLFWSPIVQNAGDPDSCMAAFDLAIDAAIEAHNRAGKSLVNTFEIVGNVYEVDGKETPNLARKEQG